MEFLRIQLRNQRDRTMQALMNLGSTSITVVGVRGLVLVMTAVRLLNVGDAIVGARGEGQGEAALGSSARVFSRSDTAQGSCGSAGGPRSVCDSAEGVPRSGQGSRERGRLRWSWFGVDVARSDCGLVDIARVVSGSAGRRPRWL